MIDNVVLLITGTLHERDTHELLERCHPLGVFDTLPALCVATSVEELYQSVLVETPLGAPNLHGYLTPPTTFSSPLLSRLPLSNRSRRPQHRNHPQHSVQSLPRRLLPLLQHPQPTHIRRHAPHPLLRSRPAHSQHHHQLLQHRTLKRSTRETLSLHRASLAGREQPAGKGRGDGPGPPSV